uniref:DnaJ domain containing protein, putative n=1 Tax=Theileria annulata TaxID=5874 RepID=A0A3B0MMK8_THEAN
MTRNKIFEYFNESNNNELLDDYLENCLNLSKMKLRSTVADSHFFENSSSYNIMNNNFTHLNTEYSNLNSNFTNMDTDFTNMDTNYTNMDTNCTVDMNYSNLNTIIHSNTEITSDLESIHEDSVKNIKKNTIDNFYSWESPILNPFYNYTNSNRINHKINHKNPSFNHNDPTVNHTDPRVNHSTPDSSRIHSNTIDSSTIDSIERNGGLKLLDKLKLIIMNMENEISNKDKKIHELGNTITRLNSLVNNLNEELLESFKNLENVLKDLDKEKLQNKQLKLQIIQLSGLLQSNQNTTIHDTIGTRFESHTSSTVTVTPVTVTGPTTTNGSKDSTVVPGTKATVTNTTTATTTGDTVTSTTTNKDIVDVDKRFMNKLMKYMYVIDIADILPSIYKGIHENLNVLNSNEFITFIIESIHYDSQILKITLQSIQNHNTNSSNTTDFSNKNYSSNTNNSNNSMNNSIYGVYMGFGLPMTNLERKVINILESNNTVTSMTNTMDNTVTSTTNTMTNTMNNTMNNKNGIKKGMLMNRILLLTILKSSNMNLVYNYLFEAISCDNFRVIEIIFQAVLNKFIDFHLLPNFKRYYKHPILYSNNSFINPFDILSNGGSYSKDYRGKEYSKDSYKGTHSSKSYNTKSYPLKSYKEMYNMELMGMERYIYMINYNFESIPMDPITGDNLFHILSKHTINTNIKNIHNVNTNDNTNGNRNIKNLMKKIKLFLHYTPYLTLKNKELKTPLDICNISMKKEFYYMIIMDLASKGSLSYKNKLYHNALDYYTYAINIFLNPHIYTPVTVLGHTSTEGPANKDTTNSTNSTGTIGPSTVTKGKGANDTFGTPGKGANSMPMECTMGTGGEETGAVGASTVMENMIEEMGIKSIGKLYYNKGRTLIHLNRWLECIESCEMCLMYIPDYINAYYTLIESYERLLDWENAASICLLMKDNCGIIDLKRYNKIIEQKDATYFQLLGLNNDATDSDIKKQFNTLCKIWHPDKHTNDINITKRCTNQFNRIYEAREKLMDPEIKLIHQLKKETNYQIPIPIPYSTQSNDTTTQSSDSTTNNMDTTGNIGTTSNIGTTNVQDTITTNSTTTTTTYVRNNEIMDEFEMERIKFEDSINLLKDEAIFDLYTLRWGHT